MDRLIGGALSRRRFLAGTGAALGLSLLPTLGPLAHAEPRDDRAQWVANHLDTRLIGADSAPVAWLPRWTRMRVLRGLPGGWASVWVPRLRLVGRVQTSALGPIAAPSPAELQAERLEPTGPAVLANVGLPGRVSGGGNLRLWPVARPETLLRTLGHNAPLRVLTSVEGDDGEAWYHVHWLNGATNEPAADGYLHSSLVRLPRLRSRSLGSPDRTDALGKWFEADLREPALLTAFEGGAPVWSTLTLKGTAADRTPVGEFRILYRVANEIMTSESFRPPIPRNAPGGYYVKDVLWTQYFTWDGASIHYNWWSSNWGYAGSHGCLGVGYNEAKFAWDWATVGTPVHVFG